MFWSNLIDSMCKYGILETGPSPNKLSVVKYLWNSTWDSHFNQKHLCFVNMILIFQSDQNGAFYVNLMASKLFYGKHTNKDSVGQFS